MSLSLSPLSPSYTADSVADPRTRLKGLIDRTYHAVLEGDLSGLDDFAVRLQSGRTFFGQRVWREFIADVVAPHPIRCLFHEDPFTRRAFEKPRGYPGDAGLLDLIYRHAPYTGELSALGTRLYAWTSSGSASRSVRERRQILAELIDHVASQRRNARILSLACGHLREGQDSNAVCGGGIREFVAIDQDAQTLAVVEREQGANRVRPVNASVRRFLAAPLAHGTFDLAYAAGLYDYLVDNVAATLTRALFDTLRPGGVLVIGNFAPELSDIGYMEAIMDWRLIYRSDADIARLASLIPKDRVVDITVRRDSQRNVGYLTVRKA